MTVIQSFILSICIQSCARRIHLVPSKHKHCVLSDWASPPLVSMQTRHPTRHCKKFVRAYIIIPTLTRFYLVTHKQELIFLLRCVNQSHSERRSSHDSGGKTQQSVCISYVNSKLLPCFFSCHSAALCNLLENRCVCAFYADFH